MTAWLLLLRGFLVVAAIGFIVSGLDDLFVDLFYYWRRAYRRLFKAKRYTPLTEEALRARAEQPVAIMIPAWHEHAVIARMLENTIRWLDYTDYDIFVGTYPNDDPTMLAVAGVQAREPRVHRIVCPHDGPTSKADCLNWVFEGIRLHEKKTGRRYAIFMIHDSEDIVHPLTLKLVNYLIPKVHMVQLPVVPLETSLRNLTAGTYLDEFAEFHTKDLLVRERVAGMIPSAGVGTGFSREAIDALAGSTRNQLFNVETLTEDYDFGFRLKDLGFRSILVQFSIERTRVVRGGWWRRRERLETVRELVATREFFPARFGDAVRQKSRWIYGIVFQGWRQIGWRGDAGMRYMIMRDRKALLVNLINVAGYVLLVLWLGTALVLWGWPGLRRADLPPLVPPGSWVWGLVVVATTLMVHRMLQRVVAVRRVSTWPQAVLSLPRMVWGNFVNFAAVWKAFGQFLHWSRTGQRVAWLKTEHAFPTETQLLAFKRKLGDLLLENRALSLQHLQHAMEVQQGTGERLGDVLTRLGYVEEDALLPVLAQQLRVAAWDGDGSAIPRALGRLIPEQRARELLALVVAEEPAGLLVAAADPGGVVLRGWLDQHLGRPYRIVLAGRQRLLDAIDRVHRRTGVETRKVMLGELLLQAGVITAEQLAIALEEQRATGKKLGEILEAYGILTAEQLRARLEEQARRVA
jgi:adsorption protein B